MVLRGVQLTSAEVDIVVDYLATVFGRGVSLPPPAKVDLPAGSGKDVVETHCAVCHDLSRLVGAKRSRDEWSGAVATMISYGAPVTADEEKAITSYLQRHFSN
jgi:cytochrome c5